MSRFLSSPRLPASLFALISLLPAACAASGTRALVQLRCDSLETPLGIDDPAPHFSWQIADAAQGAKQTAYELQVSSSPEFLAKDKPDVWDSGRVTADRSINVAYNGPALRAEQRYYWRVKAWDKDGKPYAASTASWWETGLMAGSAWQGKWIGYEGAEERHIRESGAEWITNQSQKPGAGDTRHAFRYTLQLSKPVRFAHLYVTGKDSPAAWVNGQPVLPAHPLPAWRQTPWMGYVKTDVTANVRQGSNLLAIEITRFGDSPADGQTPMSTCLYVEFADGSVQVFISGQGWKGALDAPAHWQEAAFNDAAWKPAIHYAPSDPNQSADGIRPWPTESVKMLRHRFNVASPVRSARLYATALGAYKFWINGKTIGDQVLAPGWTDYRNHVAYQVYDVTTSVQPGANAIGAYLASGWYATPLRWDQQPNNYGNTPPALKAQLRIEHTDGSVEWIATDATWKADLSPIVTAEIYDGESYDARLEQAGWSTAKFDDARWKPTAVIAPVEPAIVAQDYQPIRIEKSLTARTITNPKPGVYVFDFGQDLAGVARLQVKGTAGTDVRLRFAELVHPDGTVSTENLRSAKATDHFILSGSNVETHQPLFTFHGFRYVEITGLSSKPGIGAVTAEVFHTDAPFTVQLHTGSTMLNQLWSNILWGQRSNFVGVPTDCPQRDERLGWTGDAQVFWRTASYNMDLTQFSKKFAADLRGSQDSAGMYGIYAPGTTRPNEGYAAGWSDAGVIVPWTAWSQSGDTRVIEQNWDAMQHYLATIEEESPQYLWEKSGIDFGDWLSPEGRTRQDLLATAYWAHDVTLMREMAHAQGKSEDEQKYAALFEKIRNAFSAAFVHPDGFVDGASRDDAKLKDTQTGYVLALAMNLVPDAQRPAVAEHLVAKLKANGWHLGTGFLGTPYLLAALTDTGHADVAYRLLLSTEYPGWGYLVSHGATTMWERWNSDKVDDPGMNSYNHYAYGAVADWIYRYAAGVDSTPLDAGFHTIYLHPHFDRTLGSLDLTYQSPYGAVHSAWDIKGDDASWSLTLPANTTGSLPVAEVQDWRLAGAPIAGSRGVLEKNGRYELTAGTYTFTARLP